MKTIVCMLAAMALAGSAVSQKLKVRSYVESTEISPKLGTAIGFENAYFWEYGAFYQAYAPAIQEGLHEYFPKFSERKFLGLFFAAPISKGSYYSMKFNVRSGVSNGENFVITTSVLADFYPAKNLSIGCGIGSRAFRPTFQASVALTL